MSVRNLHFVARPASVAVFGASERPGSLGEAVTRNLLEGGFQGPIHLVNPRYETVMGRPCLKSAADLPEPPELAAIVTPAELVPQTVAELGAAGGRAAVVFSAGVDGELRRRMLEAARPHLLRIIGPDSMGVIVPPIGLDLSVSHLPAKPGRIALITQSGAIGATLIDWAAERGIGFSHVIGLGDSADVDLGDCLDLIAGEGGARAVLAFFETIPAARKFLSAARAAARMKPVIALKGGRGAAGARAAATHSGALSTADAVVDAALRRAGVLRVGGLAEMFAAVETVGRFKPLSRARLAVVTNGGGAAVLALDRLEQAEGELAALGPATIAALDAVMPPGWSGTNPIDMMADASPERYREALRLASADPEVDVTLVMNCPLGVSDSDGAAEAVVEATKRGEASGKPVLAAWLGGSAARASRMKLRAAGVAAYDTPGAAAAAVGHLTEWGEAQAALLKVPDRQLEAALGATPVEARDKAEAVFRAVAAEGRRVLTAPEAAEALAAYGIPTVPVRLAVTPVDVGDMASDMLRETPAIVVKLISRDVSHKSNVGGVALGIETPREAEDAALAIEARLRQKAPGAKVDGFALQPMIRRPLAQEVILGVARDPIFGPVILFGAGGVAVELLRDTAIALPPLDAGLAGDLVARTRAGRLLAGYSDRPPADAAALNRALVAISHMVEDFPCLRALDVNPLLADDQGVIALDARIEIDPADLDTPAPNPYLAIRPYPSAWRREVRLKDGTYLIRPILPVDVALYPDFFEKVSPEDIRMRFMAPRKHFSEEFSLRLTQLDYHRDMAFVALNPAGDLAGVSRLSTDPGREVAEYALLIRSDMAGKGLGTALMTQLIDYSRAEGLKRIEGMVLAENKGMRALIARLGFTVEPMREEPGVVMSTLVL